MAEVWEPVVQTTLRASLHGTGLARAVVAAGLRFLESELLQSYIDVLLPGDIATKYIDSEVLLALKTDSKLPQPDDKARNFQHLRPQPQQTSKECQDRPRHEKLWEELLEQLDSLGKHKQGYLVVQRVSGAEHLLAELQFQAIVERDLHLILVADEHGYGAFLMQCCRGSADPTVIALRQSMCAKRVPVTRKNVLAVMSKLPGVDQKMADALLRRFKSLGRLLRAEEEEISAVPGVSPIEAKRLMRLFRCQRGHANYAQRTPGAALAKAQSMA